MLMCEVYTVFTLGVIFLFAWLGRSYDLRTWGLAPFLPGLFAPWFSERREFMGQVIGIGQELEILRFSVIGCLLALMAVAVTVVVCFCLSWGKLDETRDVDGPESLPVGLMKAVGEEVGWRCLLLQGLTQPHGRLAAVIITAGISSLYHVPIQTVLYRNLRPRPLFTALCIGVVSNLLRSFIKGWLAIGCGFAVWPSALFQLSLERFGPAITGSLVLGTSGKMEGDLRVVCVDGVAGCISLLPIALVILRAFL